MPTSYIETKSRKDKVSISHYVAVHVWLKRNFGKANKCESHECLGLSHRYEWALKIGFYYEKKRENFVQLCKSCHTKMDTTDESRMKTSNALKGMKKTDEHRQNIKMGQRIIADKYTCKGKTMSLMEWSEFTKIPLGTLFARINYYNFPFEKAVTKKLRKYIKKI